MVPLLFRLGVVPAAATVGYSGLLAFWAGGAGIEGTTPAAREITWPGWQPRRYDRQDHDLERERKQAEQERREYQAREAETIRKREQVERDLKERRERADDRDRTALLAIRELERQSASLDQETFELRQKIATVALAEEKLRIEQELRMAMEEEELALLLLL
jgi:hypothetical protein